MPVLNRRRSASLAVALVLLAATPAFADFDAPRRVSPQDEFARHAQVTADADGNALIVWRQGPDRQLRARTLSASGDFGPIRSVTGGKAKTFQPHMAGNAAGDAFIVWRREGVRDIQGRSYSAAGERGPVELFSDREGQAEDPEVGIDAEGGVLVAWRDRESREVQARRRTAAGALGPILTLSGPTASPEIDIGMAGDGDAFVIWSRSRIIEGRNVFANGDLGPVKPLSTESENNSSPEIAVNSRGDLIVVWGAFVGDDGEEQELQARYRPAGGEFGEVEVIATDFPNTNSSAVAIDSDGNAVIAWNRGDETKLRRRRSGGGLGSIHSLSEETRFPEVAMRANGEAVVAAGFRNKQGVAIGILSADDRLGPVQTLASRAGDRLENVHVAVGAEGPAIAVWDSFRKGGEDGDQRLDSSVEATTGP